MSINPFLKATATAPMASRIFQNIFQSSAAPSNLDLRNLPKQKKQKIEPENKPINKQPSKPFNANNLNAHEKNEKPIVLQNQKFNSQPQPKPKIIQSSFVQIKPQKISKRNSTVQIKVSAPLTQIVLNSKLQITNDGLKITHNFSQQQKLSFRQELDWKCSNIEKAKKVMQKIDLFTPIVKICKNKDGKLSDAERNRLSLGFEFFNSSISCLTEDQQQSIYNSFIAGYRALQSAILAIKKGYTISEIGAFYILVHSLEKMKNLKAEKLLRLLGDESGYRKQIENLNQSALLHNQYKVQYQYFLLNEKLAFVKWVRQMVQQKGMIETDRLLRPKGLKNIMMQILNILNYKHFSYEPDTEGQNNSIKLLNLTLDEIIQLSLSYYRAIEESQFEIKQNQKIPLQTVDKFLTHIENQFHKYKDICNVEQLRNKIVEIQIPQVLNKLQSRQNIQINQNNVFSKQKININGAWGHMINFLIEDEQINYNSSNNIQQRQKQLLQVVKAINSLGKIQAKSSLLNIIKNRINFYLKTLCFTKIQCVFPRLQFLELFICLKCLQSLHPQMQKSERQINLSERMILKDKKTQKNSLINSLLNNLFQVVLSKRFTMSTIFLFLYVKIHRQQQIEKTKPNSNYFELEISEKNICGLLNVIINHNYPTFEHLKNSFISKILQKNPEQFSALNDQIYVNCITDYIVINQFQSSNMQALDIQKFFLQTFNIILTKANQQIQRQNLNSIKKIKRFQLLLKQLYQTKNNVISDVLLKIQGSKTKKAQQYKKYINQTHQQALNKAQVNPSIKKEDDDCKNNLKIVFKNFNETFLRKIFQMLRNDVSSLQKKEFHPKLKTINCSIKILYRLLSQFQKGLKIDYLKNSQFIFDEIKLVNEVLRQHWAFFVDKRISQLQESMHEKDLGAMMFMIIRNEIQLGLEMIEQQYQLYQGQQDFMASVLLAVKQQTVFDLLKTFFKNDAYVRHFQTQGYHFPSIEHAVIQFINFLFERVFLPTLQRIQNSSLKTLLYHSLKQFIRLVDIELVRKNHLVETIVYRVMQQKKIEEEKNKNMVENNDTVQIESETAYLCQKLILTYCFEYERIIHSQNDLLLDQFPSKIFSKFISCMIGKQFVEQTFNKGLFIIFQSNQNIKSFIQKYSSNPFDRIYLWEDIQINLKKHQKPLILKYLKTVICNNLLKFKCLSKDPMTMTFNPSAKKIAKTYVQEILQMPSSSFMNLLNLIRKYPHSKIQLIDQQINRSAKIQANVFLSQIQSQLMSKIQKQIMQSQSSYQSMYEKIMEKQWLQIRNLNSQMNNKDMKLVNDFRELVELYNNFFVEQYFSVDDEMFQKKVIINYGFIFVSKNKIVELVSYFVNNQPSLATIPLIVKFLYIKLFCNYIVRKNSRHQDKKTLKYLQQQQELIATIISKIIQYLVQLVKELPKVDRNIPQQLSEVIILTLPLLERVKSKVDTNSQNLILKFLISNSWKLSLKEKIFSKDLLTQKVIQLYQLSSHLDTDQHINDQPLSSAQFIYKKLFLVLSHQIFKYEYHFVQNLKQNNQSLQDNGLSVYTCQNICNLIHLTVLIKDSLLKHSKRIICFIRLARNLQSLISLIEFNYQNLLKIIVSQQIQTGQKNDNGKIYSEFDRQVDNLQQFLELLNKQTFYNRQEDNPNMSFKDFYIYLTQIIKHAKIKVESISKKEKEYDQKQLDYGAENLVYLGYSKKISITKYSKFQSFRSTFSLFLQTLIRMPELKLVPVFQQQFPYLISNYDNFAQFLTSFITFLEFNPQMKIPYQDFFLSAQNHLSFNLIYGQFSQLCKVFDLWSLSYPKIYQDFYKGKNTDWDSLKKIQEIMLLACMKLNALIAKLFSLIIDRLQVSNIFSPQIKTSFNIRERHMKYFCHLLILRLLGSQGMVVFRDFILNERQSIQIIGGGIIRCYEYKIIQREIFSLINVAINRRFIGENELQSLLSSFSYCDFIFAQKNTEYHNTNLIELIQCNLVHPTIYVFLNNKTIAHQFTGIEKIGIENKIKELNQQMTVTPVNAFPAKESDENTKNIDYFNFFDHISTLMLMSNFATCIDGSLVNLSKTERILTLVKQNTLYVEESINLIKMFYDTYFSHQMMTKQQKSIKFQKIKKAELIRNQVIEALKLFQYSFTKMDIQLHSLLLGKYQPLDNAFIFSLCQNIIDKIQRLDLSNFTKLSQFQQRQYNKLAEFFQFTQQDQHDDLNQNQDDENLNSNLNTKKYQKTVILTNYQPA